MDQWDENQYPPHWAHLQVLYIALIVLYELGYLRRYGYQLRTQRIFTDEAVLPKDADPGFHPLQVRQRQTDRQIDRQRMRETGTFSHKVLNFHYQYSRICSALEIELETIETAQPLIFPLARSLSC